jgi:uncharacterized membrane protein HdeD (DUF308 family)/predicted flap endonuclease-1-like 5' DNA nuclease
MEDHSSSETSTPLVPWWLVLVDGVAAILIGIFLLTQPAATTIILIRFLGFYWLITGIFSLVSLFWDRKEWGWKLVNGILGILVGILIIQNPLWSTLLVPTTLAIMIGIGGIIIGLIELIQAFKGGGWGIGILGVLSIILGILLLSRPVLAALALPWVFGIFLIGGGILAIFGAFGLRNVEKRAKEARLRAATAVPGGAAVQEAAVTMDATRSETAAAALAAEAAEEAEVTVDAPASETAAAALIAEAAQEAEEEPDTAGGEGAAAQEGAAQASPELSDASLVGNVDMADLTEMAKFKHELEYVEGIGPAYAGKLKAIGLVTCLDLLKAGASRKGREETAENAGIPGSLILKWVNHVDLYRVKGVGSEYADLLEAAGVDTVVELAQRNPANLANRLLEVNSTRNLVRKPPTAVQVEDWVAQAKGLPRVITY